MVPLAMALYILRTQFLHFLQLYYVSRAHQNNYLKTSSLLTIESEKSKACLQLS